MNSTLILYGNLKDTLKSYLIFKIVKNPELHNKICDENFTPYSTIPEDLIDQFKIYGLNLTGETAKGYS